MATKQRVNIRVAADLHAWAVSYAKLRDVTTTAVYERALEGLREDSETGVPDLVGQVPAPEKPSGDDRVRVEESASDGPRGRASRPAAPRVPGVRTARELWNEQAMERQRAMNKRKGL